MKNRICQIREEAHLNQTEFATRLGVTQTTVSGWERGKFIPDDRSIKLICKEFKVNYAWLVHGVGDKNMPDNEDLINAVCDEYGLTTDNEKNIMRLFLSLPHDVRTEFVDVAEKVLDEYRKHRDNSKTGST